MAMTSIQPGRPAGAVVLPAAAGRAGFGGALRSELTKIRSVRSTYWTLLALVVACVGIGALFSWGEAQHVASLAGTRDGAAVAARAHEQAVATSLFGLLIGQLVIVVLGALTITSEYSTGMIAASLTTMPRRGTVFAAKAIVFGAAARAARGDRRGPVPHRVRAAVVRHRRAAPAHCRGDHGIYRPDVRALYAERLPARQLGGTHRQVDPVQRGRRDLGAAIRAGHVPPVDRVRGVLRLRCHRDRRWADPVPQARRVTARHFAPGGVPGIRWHAAERWRARSAPPGSFSLIVTVLPAATGGAGTIAFGRPGQPDPGWQCGHQKVTRSCGSSRCAPCPAARTGLPHRRHGRPSRRYTQVSAPRPRMPVVTWPARSLFASSSRRARLTSASRSPMRPAGRHGLMPRRNSTSHLYRLPMPARFRWSSSASPMGRAGSARRRLTASAASQSGPSRSGPRCPTRRLSWLVGSTSTIASR